MFLEAFLISLCFGSQMNDDVCRQSYLKFKQQTPEMQAIENGIDRKEKNYQSKYVDTLPQEIQFTGLAAGIIYKKELKFGVYRGLIVDLQDEGRWRLGYKWSW